MERLNREKAGLRKAKTKLTEKNKSKLKQLSGKLAWVSHQSKPNMDNEEWEMSKVASAPTVKDWTTANKDARELKETDVKIKYSKLRKDKRYISVFTDASVRKLPDGIS